MSCIPERQEDKLHNSLAWMDASAAVWRDNLARLAACMVARVSASGSVVPGR